MEQAKEKINHLLEEGKKFTYENFSTKGKHGYTEQFSPKWVAWTTRINSITIKLFGKESAHYNAIQTALGIGLIGNGKDKFEQCKSYIIGTLESLLDILDNDIFGEIKKDVAIASEILSNKVFVVHGHDEVAKTSLEIFLKEIGLEPVVLHRQADQGQTIIEKFEKNSDVGYAFILLTPDEVAYLKKEHELDDKDRKIEWRARPNVIFEFGYFVGKLGRSKVCCLYTGNVSLPTDVSGMIYKRYNHTIEEVAYSIQKDLKATGYTL